MLYTRLLSRKYKNILVNCVSPGYLITDMTYQTGIITVDEGAKGPVMAALLPDNDPSGVCFNQTQIAPFSSPILPAPFSSPICFYIYYLQFVILILNFLFYLICCTHNNSRNKITRYKLVNNFSSIKSFTGNIISLIIP
ncbi:putative (+)-neomenthol dehydrogenase [Helianthus annuus]|nr:putative (+)-neomenthol dehydrogenase [Helianthus annuus]KAJ0597903.1 putative (+)-neomenthol dehydrogenase [Helianthus annuus]KAJ0932363.1 putative (+)-neomenthol dehydrogenase [Helianthus annuus]